MLRGHCFLSAFLKLIESLVNGFVNNGAYPIVVMQPQVCNGHRIWHRLVGDIDRRTLPSNEETEILLTNLKARCVHTGKLDVLVSRHRANELSQRTAPSP